MKQIFLILLLSLITTQAFAQDDDIDYTGPAQWSAFEKFMKEREEQDRISGMSYMISGAVATLGGVAGYYSSEDALSKGIYAIAQSAGVAAIGYGAATFWIGNEYNSFYRAVEESRLSQAQKSDLLRRYLAIERRQREHAKWIRVATHSLIAVVNFYSASKEDDQNVRNVFQFLGGVNAVVAISYTF